MFAAVQLPPMPPNDFTDFRLLLALLADPAAASRRVEDLAAATDIARGVIAEATAAQTALAAAKVQHDADLVAARTQHAAALADAQQKFDAQRLQQETAFAAREKRLAALEATVSADADAAAVLKADLARRLELVRAASAA